MKIFFAAVFAVGWLFSAAADPAFNGTFLAALQESEPAAQMEKIIDALEVSTEPVCDRNALKMLLDFQQKGVLSSSTYPRIYALTEKKTGDFLLAEFAVILASRTYPFDEKLLDQLEKNLTAADLNKLENTQLQAALRIISHINFHRVCRRELNKFNSFNDMLLKKYPDDKQIFLQVLFSTISFCAAANKTSPEMNSFAKLPSQDVFKQRLQYLGKKLLQMPIKNVNDAATTVVCANMLALPETANLLKKYSEIYPKYQWAPFAAEVAARLKDPSLLIKYNDFYYDFTSLLKCGGGEQAQQMLNDLPATFPEHLRQELQMIHWLHSNEYSKIVNAVNTGKIDPAKVHSQLLFAIITAGHYQQDKELLNKIIIMVNEKVDRENFSDASTLNAIGYVCADLNIQLPTAEKLIRRAVNSEPYIAAYRDSLAWVLFRQGKFQEAEKEFTIGMATAVTPYGAAVHYLHGADIKYALKKYDEATLLLGMAIQLYDPDDPGCAEYDLKAERRLQRALE